MHLTVIAFHRARLGKSGVDTTGRLAVFLLALLAVGLLLDGMRGVEASRGGLASLQKIRYWCNSNYTRVVLDLDGKVDYEVHRLEENRSTGMPPRIYIDLYRTRCAKSLPSNVQLEDGPVVQIRTAPFQRDTGRMVLDLRQAEKYKVFRMEGPNRIVIDLWRTATEPEILVVGADSLLKEGEPATRSKPLPLIVIDPGHGGADPGAVGPAGLQEKDVVFGIAKALRRALVESEKARVILTRERDVFVPLEARTQFANKRGADLFVSIHANADPTGKARGIETYYLDNTTDRASIRLAAIENRSAGRKMDDLQLILQDLRLSSNANASHQLAFLVQNKLVRQLSRNYKGVEDLGAKGNLFYVLLGAHMPSILVEVSFISNREEEKRLRNPDYLNHLARGVAAGVEGFLDQQDYSRLVAEYRE